MEMEKGSMGRGAGYDYRKKKIKYILYMCGT